MEHLNAVELYELGYSLGYQHPFMDEHYVTEHPNIAKYVTNNVNHYWFSYGYSDGQVKKSAELRSD